MFNDGLKNNNKQKVKKKMKKSIKEETSQCKFYKYDIIVLFSGLSHYRGFFTDMVVR